MVSLGLVVLAGGVTLVGVVLLVAPEVFHSHLSTALGTTVASASHPQIDDAFAGALLTSLGFALPVALVTAFAVTWIVSQRLGRSVAAVAVAADRIARGNPRVRVEVPDVGPELAQLAEAFNAMAGRLADSETTRSRLIGDLAHELRTPLASIEATGEAVVDGVLPADGATLATLADQTGRLRHLVSDMAAVSRAEERQLDLHPRPVDVAVLARDAGAAVRAAYAAARVRLDVDVVGPPPTVRADPQRLAEVFANLLDNALRHTPAGGHVRIVVHGGTAGAVVEVVDTGEGFDPTEGDRIFERFYRADSSRTRTSAGSGIGLTIARAIVEAHGGTLTATSGGPARGAAFRFELPRHVRDRSPERPV
jgi:two-component system sensor histidine kinase BaeS